MAKIKIEVDEKNVKAVISEIDEKIKASGDIVFENITIAVEDIVDEASARVPVDTGVLKSSIDKAVVVANKKIEGEVKAGAKYAPYIEFGTGGLVNVPPGLEDYATQFKGAGVKEVNLPARAFLFPAFFRVVNEMIENINSQISEEIK